MNKGNLFKGVLLIGMVAFVMAFSSCGDKNKPDPKKPDGTTTKAEATITKFKIDSVDATKDTNLVLLKNSLTAKQKLMDLVKDAKGTIGTTDKTEKDLTITKVEPTEATFTADKDTEVTITVAGNDYKESTLKFYVRLGTTATTTACKAHLVTFSVKDGVAGEKLKVDTDPTTKEFEVAHDKTGAIHMPEGKIKFTLTPASGKTKADWTGIENPTADALTQTVEASKFTKDLTVTAKSKA